MKKPVTSTLPVINALNFKKFLIFEKKVIVSEYKKPYELSL
jgi:hypothetical protein